ncbi:HIRAN domain-containing protein [Blautia sp. An81]|uniref:HIRAN domain-containing protein n=1 Tax=Blautia sp. An81 TaxID=1965659 RepID=UPI000B3792EE|nr:DNA-binding protein [Blautia sp. An81]
MSIKDGKDYLYLIWKSEKSRKQYIVGQLIKNGQYEFQYYSDVETAINDGFMPLLCFQDLNKVYKSDKLFPIFASRLPDRKRKDIKKILDKYDLEEYDEYILLKRSGARLPIDSLEFIDPILDTDQAVKHIFYVAGVRHYLECSGKNCEKATEITRGDQVYLKQEKDNAYDNNAVQMLSEDGKVFGYVPRYYSAGVSALLEKGRNIVCHIYNVDQNKNCNECIKAIMEVKK